MADPAHSLPTSNDESAGPHPRSSDETPNLPPVPITYLAGEQATGQHHDSNDDVPRFIPAPPTNPAAAEPLSQSTISLLLVTETMDGTAGNAEHQPAPDDDSASEQSESEDEVAQRPQPNTWQPMPEDVSSPCEDELAYIASKTEHSATDHAYWERKTFFDLDDPELFPVASGRIDWLIEHFNGTKEEPNNAIVMRSPVVQVGGHDWRIKFYPKGNDSDYLSVYLECVTMQGEEFEEFEDFESPPLSFLDSREKLKQRVSMAVQLAVVMYNPAEPRTYRYECDAHQFNKKDADYGWPRFTHHPRSEIMHRMHGQRQAMLRDDKLAFSAYIRIVQDPTRCMWAHGSDSYSDSIALTGLRPVARLTPSIAAELPLLHFAPFRALLYHAKDNKMVFWLQCLLWKMMSRTRSARYGCFAGPHEHYDVPAWYSKLSRHLLHELEPKAIAEIIGSASGLSNINHVKLKTKQQVSVQDAIDAYSEPTRTPALLMLEMERTEFDRSERRWKKITNKVDMQDRITISGTCYVLYGFVTHCGDLTSNRFNVYIRPRGPEGLFYAYTNGNITAMTHKQALSMRCGGHVDGLGIRDYRRSSLPRQRRNLHQQFVDLDEVAHVVYYVRDDYRSALTDQADIESWDVPNNVKEGKSLDHISDVTTGEQQPVTVDVDHASEHDHKQTDAVTDTQDERLIRMNTSTGAATPSAWNFDGEDVLMSDVQEDSTQPANDTAPELALEEDPLQPSPGCKQITIECLGREYYRGGSLDGLYYGEGHLIAMNGNEYIGNFLAGEKSGYGKQIYAESGNIYEGQWVNDRHHGQGTLTESKTGNVFEGGWKHGRKSGDFVLKGSVTEDDKGMCSICYEKEINTAFYDCGHVMACRDCAHKISTCPICRRRVVARLELFGVKMTFD